MSKNLYRASLVLTAFLAIVAGILFFCGITSIAAGVLALTIATMPLLIHAQTREVVRITRTSELRLSKSFGRQDPTTSSSDTRAIKEELSALSQRFTAFRDEQRTHTRSANPNRDLLATANEIRRESRMVRLIASQILDDRDMTERNQRERNPHVGH